MTQVTPIAHRNKLYCQIFSVPEILSIQKSDYLEFFTMCKYNCLDLDLDSAARDSGINLDSTPRDSGHDSDSTARESGLNFDFTIRNSRL